MTCDSEFKARIEQIDEEYIEVTLLNGETCSGCLLSKECNIEPSKNERLKIPRDNYNNKEYRIGQEVLLVTVPAVRHKAIFSAFVLPCAVLILAIAITRYCGGNELYGAFAAIIALLGYFGIVYGIRKKLKIKYYYRLKPL